MKKSELKTIVAECINEVVLEEGLYDRMKARTKGAFSGAGKAIKGSLDNVDAKLFNSPTDKYNASKNLTIGKNKYNVGKIKSYKKSAETKLNNVANEIMVDLKKLGISTTGVSAKQINFFKGSLVKALDELISKIPTGP
jgi:hypothetical protein